MSDTNHTAPADQSGVHLTVQPDAALRCVARWAALQPDAARFPAEVHALAREVDATLRAYVLLASGGLDSDGPAPREMDVWLDATYVLERLQWCIVHGVPYVERPRVPLVG